MLVFATVNAPPSPESLKFPVFSQLAGNFASETGSLETPSSSRQSVSRRNSRPAVTKPGFSAGAPPGTGAVVGRDAPGAATWRQKPSISLPSLIPVPQRPARSRQSRHWRTEVCLGIQRCRCCFELGSAQAKPSTVRCSCQASGRRECASSLSAVRSRGWRPSRIACVISGAR